MGFGGDWDTIVKGYPGGEWTGMGNADTRLVWTSNKERDCGDGGIQSTIAFFFSMG